MARIRLQNVVHIGLEPPLRGRQVFDVPVRRRLDTKERDLMVSLHTERISSVDVVPIPNSEIRPTTR